MMCYYLNVQFQGQMVNAKRCGILPGLSTEQICLLLSTPT